jgi:hypothetical protein
VVGVLLAEAAILAQLDAIGCVLLVLGRVVVAALALVAGKGDFDTHGFTSVYFALRRYNAGKRQSIYTISLCPDKDAKKSPSGEVEILYHIYGIMSTAKNVNFLKKHRFM